MSEIAQTPAGVPIADFEVDSEIDPATGQATVSVRGEVDIYTASRLRECLYDLAAEGRPVVVLDLACMSFIDSTGLGVIVGTLKRLREHDGQLIVRSPTRSTRKVLEITGLSNILTIEEADPA